ncbi:MAG TPA: DUF1934 domain-containing protein [Candidatus Pullilachnospira intestinigallinarum]|nr:DUF1934 domain-containing protein [Candidatus Pullilachnospira intestinigallinarum]
MTKEVLIHIRGLHTPDGGSEEEPLELITTGEYYFRNNTHYLLYDEMMEGFTEPSHNMIKIRPGLMEVRKKGVVNVQMIFEKDKKNLAIYKTPFGRLEMEIAATRIIMGESSSSFEIHAEYALGMNGSPVTDCVMDIRAIPREDKNFRIVRD